MAFIETLIFTLGVTAPLFFWIALGYLFKQIGWLPIDWINRGSWSMFYIFLPILMFVSTVRKPLTESLNPVLMFVCFAATLVVFLLARQRARRRSLSWAQSSVFQQGALRGNLGIIGVSLCLNAYGQEALLNVSILMAILAVFYNILSTYIFVSATDQGAGGRFEWLGKLLVNPLILASVLGLLVNVSPLSISEDWLDTALDLIQYTFPIALVCVGGALSFKNIAANLSLTRDIALLKLVIMPVIAVGFLLLLGFRGETVGLVFLLTASPVATASFVMARAYRADATFAADVVVTTTFAALLTLSLGVFVLRSFQLM